jgi:hypothetical protein
MLQFLDDKGNVISEFTGKQKKLRRRLNRGPAISTRLSEGS